MNKKIYFLAITKTGIFFSMLTQTRSIKSIALILLPIKNRSIWPRKNPKCYISVGSNKYLIQDLKEAVVLQFGAQSFLREEAGARNAKLHCLGGCGFDAECKTLSVEQILGKRRNRAGNANCSWEPKTKIKRILSILQFEQDRWFLISWPKYLSRLISNFESWYRLLSKIVWSRWQAP